MLATFQVKNSTVELNGVDISGLSNTLEVTIAGNIVKHSVNRKTEKVSTSVLHKGYFKRSDLETFNEICNRRESKCYSFSREKLQYTMENVDLLLSKKKSIAGVVPIELVVSSTQVPSRSQFNGSLKQRI